MKKLEKISALKSMNNEQLKQVNGGLPPYVPGVHLTVTFTYRGGGTPASIENSGEFGTDEKFY